MRPYMRDTFEKRPDRLLLRPKQASSLKSGKVVADTAPVPPNIDNQLCVRGYFDAIMFKLPKYLVHGSNHNLVVICIKNVRVRQYMLG
jgi:hypothetical protein